MGADGRLFVILNAQHVSSMGSEVIIKPRAAPFVPYCLGRGAGLQTARAKKKVLKRSVEKVIPQRKASGTKSRFAQQTCVQDPTGKKVTASRAPGMSSPLQPGSSSKCFPWYAFNITSLFFIGHLTQHNPDQYFPRSLHFLHVSHLGFPAERRRSSRVLQRLRSTTRRELRKVPGVSVWAGAVLCGAAPSHSKHGLCGVCTWFAGLLVAAVLALRWDSGHVLPQNNSVEGRGEESCC